MALFPRDGRVALAEVMFAQPIHVAWGTGRPDWGTARQSLYVFAADDSLATGHSHISAVSVASPDGVTVYAADIDYTVDPAAGLVTRLASGAIVAQSQVRVDLTVDIPPPDTEQTALLAEVGRRTASLVEYCRPDAAGTIVTPSGNWAASATPTNSLHVYVQWDFADAAAEVIREMAVVMGTHTDPALPAGQLYFLPADIVAPGRLMLLDNGPIIGRTGATREFADFVLTL